MIEPIRNDEQHDEADSLLPWYATGEIEPRERAIVESHLATCAACRDQLALERRLIDEFQTHSPEVDSGWARIRGRIQTPARQRPKVAQRFEEIWQLLTRPAVAVLATAELAIIAIGGALVSFSQPAYQALGSAPAPASANALVMFRAGATEEEIATALKANGATIVGGPTPTDAYMLHIAAARRQAAIAGLQSNAIVKLAQPIDGAQQ
jgi:anti-sigma factor RsiW